MAVLPLLAFLATAASVLVAEGTCQADGCVADESPVDDDAALLQVPHGLNKSSHPYAALLDSMIYANGSREPPPVHLAALLGRPGRQVQGVILIRLPNDSSIGADFEYNISGLTANQLHGFHIHEGPTDGGCGNDDECGVPFTGGHWNPADAVHGGPIGDAPGHDGDLGNIQADASGRAQGTIYWPLDINDVLGKSFVVHADPDDLKTNPTGNAGDRIACGTITFIAALPTVAPPCLR